MSMDGFFMGEMPEELQAAIREHQQQQQMAHEDTIHTLYRTMEEMEVEHLEVIRNLLHHVGDTPQAMGYWEGILAATIGRRKKVCFACGRDHDADARALLEEDQTDEANLAQRAVTLMQMYEYNVEPTDDENLAGEVRCTGIEVDGVKMEPCNLHYVSLEDRMLRGPNECHGCQTRSGHG